MSKIVRFEKTVADSILTAAMSSYPRETILVLQGKKVGDKIRLNNVLIPQCPHMDTASVPYLVRCYRGI